MVAMLADPQTRIYMFWLFIPAAGYPQYPGLLMYSTRLHLAPQKLKILQVPKLFIRPST